MARPSNPARPSNAGGSPRSQWENPSGGEPPRRNFLVEAAAVVFGGILSIYPLFVGSLVFLDPIFKRWKKEKDEGPAMEGEIPRPYLRVAFLSALPDNGTPVQVPVLSDLTDAWNRETAQPIGAVYLINNKGSVSCFNAICPHAGCFVGFSAQRKMFQCPCHTSSFQTDGTRNMPSPSPRDMDSLKVDEEKLKQGEVWVQFANYFPGKEHKELK